MKPHVVVVPFPVHGHINPIMHLALHLAAHGFIITFVTTHHNYSTTLKPLQNKATDRIRLRAIPDGLPDDDSRADFARLARVTETAMGPSLHTLIHQINENEEHKVTYLIADFFASWALDVAKSLQIPTAGFWPGIIAAYAIIYHIPELISNRIIPPNGIPTDNKRVKYLSSMPSLCCANLPWLIGSQEDQEFRFQFWLRSMARFRHLSRILCNSFYDLEVPIIKMFPKEAGICPVGPLIPHSKADIVPEKHECLEWLDKQSPGCVIYVSFGSSIVLDEREVGEFAAGLEAVRMPFMWVVRGVEAFLPSGYSERIGEKGCVMGWAPQMSVLSHPAVGCFVTHCGWNSSLESIMAGVPMLCRPCVADQFLNCAYIVDVWKIGLELETNKDGIVEREMIERLLRTIMGDEGVEMRERAAKLREYSLNTVEEGGQSSVYLNEFFTEMIGHDQIEFVS